MQPLGDVGELRGAGGFWSKIFDVQGARFTAVTCQRCKYTEFFKADTSLLGNIFGAVTGLSYGLCIMGLRWLGRGSENTSSTIGAVCCGNLLAAAVTLPMALPVSSSTPGDWGAVIYLGLFQVAVAYAFLVRGVARVTALEASLILLAEPVLSPFWAWLAHGEVPTAWAMTGGAIILGATAVMTISSQRES